MPLTVVPMAADSFLAGSTMLIFMVLPLQSPDWPELLSGYLPDRPHPAHRMLATASACVSPAAPTLHWPAPAMTMLLADNRQNPSPPPWPVRRRFPDNGSLPGCNIHKPGRRHQC